MSNKDVQGCANVSRNVTVGGTVSVGGSVLVSHHLVVKGWVDAPHVKGPMKGLYASETALRAAYPRPEPGWFALVGNTLPAAVWRSQSGSWQPTGEQGGEFSLWLDVIESDISKSHEAITNITGRLEAHDTTLTDYGTRITAAENTLSAQGKTLTNHDTRISAAEKTLADHGRRLTAAEETLENQDELIADLQDCASDHGEQLKELEKNVVYWRDVNASEGVAPLDEMGRVPEVNLPVQEIFDKQVWNLAGKPDGVVLLDDEGQVPAGHLREVVMRSEAGKPGGIAPLDEEGIVPAEHLPDMVYRREVGQPGGVAPLMAAGTEGEGTVPLRHLPRAALNSQVTATIGKAEGIASLDAEAHVPMEQLALGRMMVRVGSEEEMEALIESGKWDEDKIYYTVEE